MIVPPTGQAPLSAVVLPTSATFPAVPDIAIVPVASGVGRFVVPPRPGLLHQVVPAGPRWCR